MMDSLSGDPDLVSPLAASFLQTCSLRNDSLPVYMLQNNNPVRLCESDHL